MTSASGRSGPFVQAMVCLVAAGFIEASAAPPAEAAGDVTPLGRSASSGAVCQAVRDYEDPVAQRPAGRAWSIRCLGWDVATGRLYRLPSADAVEAWRKDLAARATCPSVKSQPMPGFARTELRLCHAVAQNTPYIAYIARRGRFTQVAEGYAQVADVLETGLKVTAGLMAPPAAAQSQSSQAAAAVAADFGGEMTGLASAEKAAAADPARLIQRGYLQNSEWRFSAAETDFRSLAAAAQARNAPPADRARAWLNLALNVSDDGRFAEADALFDRADPLIAASGDQALKALALNYRAYQLRNQRRFAEAADTARKALSARALARRSASASMATAARATEVADALTIDATLADALNIRPGGGAVLGGDQISSDLRLAIRDAEALEIEGSSKLAAGDAQGALAALELARAKLKPAEDQGVDAVKLRARLESDVGDVDLASGRAAAAAERYDAALKVLRTRHAGSTPEGGLLLDLGQAEIAAGRIPQALASYDQGFAVFKTTRGALGASADRAGPYLDLLIDLSKSDPAHAADYAARFFAAAEAVVSEATAATVSRLAARVASGDQATAGLVRAIDDTRRDMAAAESRIAVLQSRGAYIGEAKVAADEELKRQQGQLALVNAALLATNPRYDQMVASTVSLSSLQKALRPGEVYLKTLLLSDRGYGLLIGPDLAIPYAIPLGRAEAVNAAAALRAPMQGAGDGLEPFDVAAAHSLFQAMMGPVAEPLLKARHLIYEPDGKLVSLPAAVLVTDQASVDRLKPASPPPSGPPDYRGVAWLGARLDSSLVLSAASFVQARGFQPSHARRLYLGFADPRLARSDPRAYASLIKQGVADLSQSRDLARATRICEASRRALLKIDALPDTGKEAHVIAASLGAPNSDVVTGPDFDDASVRGRRDLGDYKIVYFATHALLPMPDACLPEPALLTSLGQGDSDGLLEASEIVNLKLDADLVVLSACDTGGAGAADDTEAGLVGGGEALSGLTRAFIYAGARGLIVSHWAVDSAATEQLMTDLFQSGAGSQSEGLKQAQARMQADARLSHPYFWAPFTIVGDGGRPIPSASAPAPTVASNAARP